MVASVGQDRELQPCSEENAMACIHHAAHTAKVIRLAENFAYTYVQR